MTWEEAIDWQGGKPVKKYIPYEKALEILEKIDDSYFSEEVTDNPELLDEVWQMLWLAGSLFKSCLDICGPQGEPGVPVGTDQIRGEFYMPDEVQEKAPSLSNGRFMPFVFRMYAEKEEDKPAEGRTFDEKKRGAGQMGHGAIPFP